MKRLSFMFLIAILLTIGLVGSLFAAEPIKLGFVASITGGASFLGEPEKNTAIMIQDWSIKKGESMGDLLRF